MNPDSADIFLGPAVLDAAFALLDEQRAAYSIDEYFSQTGITDDEVADVLMDECIAAAGDLCCLCPGSDRLAVHREVVAPADWDWTAETRPHRHWSHDATLAHAHWAEGDGVRWLLTATVEWGDVLAAETIACNANPSLREEGEIMLRKECTPVVSTCERRPDDHRHPTL